MSSRLSADQLAEALGITRRAVTRYIKAGCPHERQGKGVRAPLRFDLEAVEEWMRETVRTGEGGRPEAGLEVTPTEREPDPLLKLAREVNIEIKQLEVERRRRVEREAAGQSVPLELVKQAWAAQVEIVHARFRAMPSVLAGRCVGKTYDAIYDLLEEELRSVLVSISQESLDL